MDFKWRGWAVVGIAVLGCAGGTAARADTIRVQSTTDTIDAGLADGYNGIPGLKTLFTKWEADNGLPADTLQYVGVGTGKALDNARLGMADVVITHAPSLESQFVQQGYSLEPFGRAIFFSDYVILGPPSDPAGVLGGAPHDAVGAFEKIAAAGAAGQATFVSRDENSGTNVQEQLIWGLTGGSVPKQPSPASGATAAQSVPVGSGGAGTYPAWYKRTGKGQALNVQDADACTPTDVNPNPGCYTITDRGTFNKLVNSQTITHLKVLADKNAAAARGGQNLLVNPFSAYVVNPAAPFATPPTTAPNVPAATRFADFLVSPAFQDAVNTFPSASDPAFQADAFAKLTTTPPASAIVGAPVPLSLTFTSRLPGGGAVGGLPVTLQQSTDGGKAFTTAGTATTDASGVVAFAPVITATTTYRASLPRYHQFSPNVQTVGVVAAILPPTARPPGPITPPVVHRSAPVISKVTLSAKKLTFAISAPATVKVTFALRTVKRVKGRSRVSYRTTRTITVTATKAGRVSHAVATLKAATYRVTLKATDAHGDVRSRALTLRVRAARRATGHAKTKARGHR